MSLARFQSLLARLVTDAVFRQDARENPAVVLEASGLTTKERGRLVKLLDDRGLDLTATLPARQDPVLASADTRAAGQQAHRT